MSHSEMFSALSPLDGRYRSKTNNLACHFSESALIKYRVFIEISYLLFISKNKIIPKIDKAKQKVLMDLYRNLNDLDLVRIKEIERKVGHDVKAIEYFLREKFEALGIGWQEFIHIGLTSEDINNLSYSLAIKESLEKIIIPELKKIIKIITKLAEKYKEAVMLARTHGQAAVPTTVGKELIVFAQRLFVEVENLRKIEIEGKLNGAVGNFNAHVAVYPEFSWIKMSREFVESLGLKANIYTTQILFPDSYVRVFQSLSLINTILIGFCQDMWRYVSDNYLLQKIDSSKVGSSTMPQKVNPIDFENCEGNCGMANALLKFFNEKLPISRLQRDLSDSTVKRNIGCAFGYCLVAYQSVQTGLMKISVNEKELERVLSQHWEVITEGIQTILRSEGNEKAYEDLKMFAMGKKLGEKEVEKFIEQLEVSKKVKEKLRKLNPFSYVGLAEKIAEEGILEINNKL
jgi:adenylosuccinate lyase